MQHHGGRGRRTAATRLNYNMIIVTRFFMLAADVPTNGLRKCPSTCAGYKARLLSKASVQIPIFGERGNLLTALRGNIVLFAAGAGQLETVT